MKRREEPRRWDSATWNGEKPRSHKGTKKATARRLLCVFVPWWFWFVLRFWIGAVVKIDPRTRAGELYATDD
jgi:hypothetical protein